MDALGELPGVTVVVKGSSNGTTTDLNGEFLLKNVKPNDVIQFSFIGYKTQTIKVGNQKKFNITMTEDGYFVTSIPYDKGFTVYVDGKEIEYETVNQAFLGFPLEKGKHHITFTYEAPLKKAGMMISIIGFILFIGVIVIDKKKEVR